MADLTSADVELYTRGRLLANDVETYRLLRRALVAARRYCEWHVTPVIAHDVMLIDGSGGRVQMIPTMNVVALHSVIENGIVLDPLEIRYSSGTMWSKGPVRLRKRWPARWSCDYGSIAIDITHGFNEADAEDFRVGVLDAIDRFSRMATSDLRRYRVDNVEREWFDRPSEAFNTNLLDPYKLSAPV